MTLVVTHSKVSTKPVGNDSTRIYSDSWNANHVLTGTTDATQLNANVVQSVTNDTNIQGTISNQNLTFSWGGTLAAARLNANVVQGVTNDTNITGSISAQNLTFSWSGLLGLNRGGTNADLSATGGAHQVLKQSTVGAAVTVGQLAFTDISGTVAATQLPNPTASTLGGIESAAPVSHQWINSISTSGVPSLSQPAFTDISGSLNLATQVTGNLSVNNLNSGTSASNSTFWRGDGTWATPAGGGTVTSVVANGVTITNTGTVPPPYGIVNHSLAVSASAGALTIALKDNAGNDPSSTSPVNGYFRNVTGTTGSWTQLSVTSALSLTLPSSSTLGISSSTACRIWIVLFNDAATARLGAINCSNSSQIFPLVEGVPASSTAVSGSSTSAGVFYTGSAVTSKSFLIVGYLEWSSSGLTAGTWTTTNLNFIQSFGPGIKKPGDEIQTIYFTTASSATNATNTFASSNLTANITPTSAANLILSQFAGTIRTGASNLSDAFTQLFRGSTAIGSIFAGGGNTGAVDTCAGGFALDLPNSTSSTTYVVKIRNSDNATTITFPIVGGSSLILKELMG